MEHNNDNQQQTNNHLIDKTKEGEGSNKTFFKVKFLYDKNAQGRSVWIEDIKLFDAINSDELHLKIDKYITERTTSIVNRWYYMKMVDIERL